MALSRRALDVLLPHIGHAVQFDPADGRGYQGNQASGARTRDRRLDGAGESHCVTTRDEALYALGQIKQELRDGTFIGSKKGKP